MSTEAPVIAHVVTEAFSDVFAEVYDEVYPGSHEEQQLVEFVADLVPTGARVLDVGIGTGRLALPLAEAGFAVHGVELSTRMLERLRAKDGSDAITTTHGAVGDVEERDFDLALATFNVLLCALSQEDQLRMLADVTARLAPEGRLVVQSFDPTGFHGRTVDETRTLLVPSGGVLLESTSVHSGTQLMTTTVALLGRGAEAPTATTVLRYLWPSELDLLAAHAGLDLVDRYADWQRSPFRGGTPGEIMISVFRRR